MGRFMSPTSLVVVYRNSWLENSRIAKSGAPFGVIFVGIACAALAHFVSPWATPVIVASYFLVSLGEYVRERN